MFEINCCQQKKILIALAEVFIAVKKSNVTHRSGNNRNDTDNNCCADCTPLPTWTRYGKILLRKESVTITFLFVNSLLCVSIAFYFFARLFFSFPLRTELLKYKKKNFFVLLFSPFWRKFERKGPKKKKNRAVLLRTKDEQVRKKDDSNANGVNRKKVGKSHLTAKRASLENKIM